MKLKFFILKFKQIYSYEEFIGGKINIIIGGINEIPAGIYKIPALIGKQCTFSYKSIHY